MIPIHTNLGVAPRGAATQVGGVVGRVVVARFLRVGVPGGLLLGLVAGLCCLEATMEIYTR